MNNHRNTCISRLAELGEDPALYAAVIYALALNNDTRQLSLAVQAVLELRDSIADETARLKTLDELESRPPRG